MNCEMPKLVTYCIIVLEKCENLSYCKLNKTSAVVKDKSWDKYKNNTTPVVKIPRIYSSRSKFRIQKQGIHSIFHNLLNS
jgi:hypothetical protein